MKRQAARGPLVVLIVAACAFAASCSSTTDRSRAQRDAFQRANPCPATGEPRGACPGFVVDHIVPLCAGGADSPANMQWQTVVDAKAKDREEVRQCRAQ